MNQKQTIAFIVLSSFLVAASAQAAVKPAVIFSDHMVLQSDTDVPVWGWADAGEAVTVSIGAQKRSTTAGPDGKWMVRLGSLDRGGPQEMTISGKNTIKISDVLVGEVWLGSGQSNMEFTVSKDLIKYPTMAKRFSGVINEEAEIAAANYPQIRMFTAKMKTSKDVLDDVEGEWKVCSPETVPGFSAIGYFFSRDLQKSINKPVGFINSSYGASCAQAWISKDVLEADPKFAPVLATLNTAAASYEDALARAATQPAATQPEAAGARRGGARGRGGPRNPFTDQHMPYVLYNAMLKGVQPYAIKGVLWYQGESITTGGTAMYTELMDTLILSWRKQWNRDLPFYFVQLASLDNNSNRPEVREAQAKSLRVPNTAMAVTLDIGDKSDVHPHNKQDLGARLARMARAREYGEKIEYLGPMYDSMAAEGNSVRVKFTHAGGLSAKDGDLKWFEVAGADGAFQTATAKIDGGTVVVSSPAVAQPTAVRYAWHRWPEGANLYNADGLPAAPFRSNPD